MTTPPTPAAPPLEPQPNFEQIVRDHQALVFRTLARLLGRTDHLEDLAQDVFLRLYRALPTFRGDSQLSTYLYRITLNVAHDEATRRTRDRRRHISLSTPLNATLSEDATLESTLPHPDPTPLGHLEHQHFTRALEHHLQQLSHPERAVLILFHQEDQTYEQIALALTLPINTVRTHLHRARKKLRDALSSATSAATPASAPNPARNPPSAPAISPSNLPTRRKGFLHAR